MSEQNLQENDTNNKLSAACATIESRLDTIWNAIDAVDTKTNIILGFASVVLVVLVGFFSLEPSRWSAVSKILFMLALVTYVILVILSILSYKIRSWSYKPDPTTLLGHCLDASCSLEDIKKWIATESNSAVETNLNFLGKKSKTTNCVLYLFALETVLLAAGLVYGLLSG